MHVLFACSLHTYTCPTLLTVRCARFALRLPPRATALRVFDTHHVAYHGTPVCSGMMLLWLNGCVCSSLLVVIASFVTRFCTESACVWLSSLSFPFTSPHSPHPIHQIERLLGVLNTGTLAKKGDTVYGGVEIAVRPGHIPAPHTRVNLHTGVSEEFDPDQVKGTAVLCWALRGPY
jgi:hypothetical protein